MLNIGNFLYNRATATRSHVPPDIQTFVIKHNFVQIPKRLPSQSVFAQSPCHNQSRSHPMIKTKVRGKNTGPLYLICQYERRKDLRLMIFDTGPHLTKSDHLHS